MITIYDKTGTAKLSVPIADKCVHHRGIMEEEYVPVIFNYDEAIQLSNGDYIDTEYGRFEIVKFALPEDKTASDGGYSYEQRFNPRWWRASQRKLFYNRQAGYEASWKMTHYASYFMDIVVDNMLRAGIGEFTYEIDADITGMQFVQFDGVSIIDGLTLIAEAWGVEWWFTDNVVHLGRCNYGSSVLLSMDDALADIQREESADTEYATRLFVFGSTRNIPKNYRKDLVFTVSAIQSSGNVISDTSRPLLSEWFPKALQTEVSYDTRKFDLPAKSINKEWFYASSGTGNCAISYSSLWVGQLAPRKYVLDLSNIKISCKWKKMFSGGLSQLYVKATIKGSGGTVASYIQPVKSDMLDISTEDTEYTFNGVVLPFTIKNFISASILLEVFVVSTTSNDYEVACSCTSGSISLSSKDKVYHVSGLTIETIEDVPRKIEGVIFNPYYATNDSETNWLKLPDGVTLAKGTKYRISPIHLSKVDSGYFVPVVGEDEVINELTDNRLAIPAANETPYIDAWENLAEEDVVEAIVTTETIFPRRTGTIDSITTKEYTETIENEDGTTTEKKWNAYRFTDTGITFSESYIIDEELRVIFQSGKLVGKDFRVNFNPDGASEESEEAQVWEIVRNEDYGTALPTDDFGPAVGDTYILYGYDTSFVADSLVEDAEQELLEYGKEQAKKLSADKSNYRCETNVVRCAGYQEDANGVMQYNEGDVIDLDIGAAVELVHPVYFPDGAHASRIRSFDRSLINRYEVTYLVGEAKNYSRTGELAEKIDAIEYQSKQKEATTTSSGTSVYIIKRNDVTVASDHNVFSSLRSRLEFMCRSVAEYVRTCWTFAKGIYIGSYVAGESGARIDENGNAEVGNMDVRGDATVGGTATAKQLNAERVIADSENDTATIISSKDFDGTSTLAGYGYGIMKDGDNYKMAIDYLTVRKGMTVAELVIQEYKSVGGVLVLSACNGEIDTAEQDGDSNYWMIDIKDWDKHPQFVSGDIIRCSRWDDATNTYVSYIGVVDASEAEEEGATQHIYVQIVSGDATPQAGDNLVQFGNTTDTSRQGLIIISTEDGKPNITLYDGLNSADVNMDDKMTARLGNLNGLTKDDKDLSGYGLWTNNLYLGSKAEEIFKDLINIGGRNYALGTGDPFTASLSTTASDWQDMRMYYAKGLKTGDVVNVSFDWTAVGASSSIINKIMVQFGYGTETSINTYQDGEEILLSAATGKYNCQFEVPNDVTENTIIHVRLRVFSNSVTSITTSHLMVQKGQGEWNIAPEDLNNALTEYKSEVSHEFDVTNQGLSSVQRSVTQLKDGSRNLLLNTNQGARGWKPMSIYSVGGVKGEYTAFTREAYSTDNHYELFCFDLRPELIQKGKQYLLSFEIYLPEDYSNVDNVAMFTAFASPSFTDVLSYNSNERNNQKTQIGSWVKMEYVITANASGAKDYTTSIYISITRTDYNKFQYFYIRNLQLLERTADSAIAVTDDEFLPWRPALEDANNYADVVAEQAKQTAITQTKDDINIGAYAKTTYVDGKIEDAKAEIKVTTDSISQSVSNLSTSVDGEIAGLESEIKQTADSISLKVKELGITSLNYAYGTSSTVEIKTLSNIYNQTYSLYRVTGLSAKDIVSLSFVIRIKDVIFDTQNDAVDARLIFQLDDNFGYQVFGIYLRQSDFDNITADTNGYKTLRVTATGITIPDNGYTIVDGERVNHTITPDIVGGVYMRLDYIDSEVDAEGNDTGVIEISELKIEKGDECTAWTSRTQDMYEALLDTGIDIENKKIVATTDKFVIQNNLGQVTASVDENGNLATGTVLCWNKDDATKVATPYLTTLNCNGNGYLEFYYPLENKNDADNVAFQIGWDSNTNSVFRFYKQDGSLAWTAGDTESFINNMSTETVTTITPESFHYFGDITLAVATTRAKTTKSLSANATLYRKTVQVNGVITENRYYTDKSCTALATTGIYTMAGTPQLGFVELGSETTIYSRTLYQASNGSLSGTLVTWEVKLGSVNDTIIDSPSLPNQ